MPVCVTYKYVLFYFCETFLEHYNSVNVNINIIRKPRHDNLKKNKNKKTHPSLQPITRPGEHAELQRQESADGHSFQQGDKVKCLLEVEILRQMQEGHGGWNPKMAEVLHTIPNVLTIDCFT